MKNIFIVLIIADLGHQKDCRCAELMILSPSQPMEDIRLTSKLIWSISKRRRSSLSFNRLKGCLQASPRCLQSTPRVADRDPPHPAGLNHLHILYYHNSKLDDIFSRINLNSLVKIVYACVQEPKLSSK